jgi:sugar/nucleoside kinase (ribokinase family)
MKYDLTTFGHIVLDWISSRGSVQGPRVGGPCTYAGLAANALCARVIAVSKVGPDFASKRFCWLRAHGISTSHVRIARSDTTCFRINYQNGERTMRVTSICDPISNEDLSQLPTSSAIHIGPVLHEILPSLAIRLASNDSVVGLDPQGYLRQLDSEGNVHARKWSGHSLLKKIAVLKISEGELPAIIGMKRSIRKLCSLGPDIILLTKGSQGIMVWSRENGMFSVPAHETYVRDPTGAGDALAGAFLVTWVRTNDLLWSAAVGSAVASIVVARTRLAEFGTRRQIERRAMRILDRATRI